MAKTIEKATLQVQVDNGVNAAGSPVSKNYNFANLNPAASDAVAYAAGAAIGGLMRAQLQAVRSTEKYLLTADEPVGE